MDDDNSSLASCNIEEEDLLKTYQVVPDSGMHYQILVFQSEKPIELTVNLQRGQALLKELKSHHGDEKVLLNSCLVGDSIKHLGTTVDSSRAKAIWDTINGSDLKPEEVNTTSTPVLNSSPNSSFAVINELDHTCDREDLHRASMAAGDLSSVPAISETSSFAHIRESEEDNLEEPEDNYGDEWFSELAEEPPKSEESDESEESEEPEDPEVPEDSEETEEPEEPEEPIEPEEPKQPELSEVDKKLRSYPYHLRPTRHEYCDEACRAAIAPLQKAAENLRKITEATKFVRSMCLDEASEGSQPSSPSPSSQQFASSTTEKSFRPPSEDQEGKLENLMFLVLEYMSKITDTYKDPRSTISPLDLTIDYFNRILDSRAFMELTEEQLDKVFNIKRAEPELEASLTRGVIRWSEFSAPRRGKLAAYLAKCELKTVRADTLVELSKMNAIRFSVDCRDVIDKHKNNLLMAIANRQHRLPTEFLYVLTHDRLRVWQNNIYQINPHDKSFERLTSRPAILFAATNSCLFVFARRDITQRAIDIFQFSTKEWTTMSNWPSDVLITSMCTYNHCIYFIAAIGSSYNFYKFDPSIDEFKMIIVPSDLILKLNEKLVPYEETILFIPSGHAYHTSDTKWINYASFESRFSTAILAVHNNRIIFPFGNDLLRWFDPKTGNHGCHSNWYNRSGKNGHLIDLTVINKRFYLLERCTTGLSIFTFNGQSWDFVGDLDLQSEPLRCAITTDY